VLAARAAALVTGGNGGTQLTSATTLYKTSATDLAAGIYSAAQTLDEKDVPVSLMRRASCVRRSTTCSRRARLLNRDWGGSGSYAEGSIPRIAAWRNREDEPPAHHEHRDGRREVPRRLHQDRCVVCNEMAVGTVKLLDLALARITTSAVGTLFVAKYARRPRPAAPRLLRRAEDHDLGSISLPMAASSLPSRSSASTWRSLRKARSAAAPRP
jgi:hypothetical protein